MTNKTKDFIDKAIQVHGDKYDYSKTIYENNLKEVIIICKEHGEFMQLPKTHKRGSGCNNCGREKTGNSKKSNTNDFINKAKLKHGDNYDYSKVDYKKANEKIIIICKKHGDFLQTPNSHLDGAGCKKCSIEYITGLQKSNSKDFIEKANIVHVDKYDYSKVDYINYNTNVLIICKDHGEFSQSPHSHLKGSGCYDCSILSRNEKRTKTTETFIKEATKKHGNTFDYSKTIYVKCDENIIIICKEHGEFKQTPTGHLKGTFCCPKCNLLNIGKWNSITQEEFINKALERHGNNYDYTKVKYKKAIDKIIITCYKHGDFEITPNSHLNGSGCKKCSIEYITGLQKSNSKDFIEKANIVHVDKYDYSKVVYTNNHTKIIIICKEHGEFEQTPQGHLSGRGCIKCSNKYQYTTEEWIIMAKQLHGDKYDYSKSIYKNANENIIIICKKHGQFYQLPRVHLRPTDCFRCNPKQFSKKQIEWLNFISKYYNVNIQHAMNDNEYIISTTKYKADGYCEETNTIYEFHGDLWHGNPKIYNLNDTSYFGVKYGELYEKTLEREKLIKDLGYNLVVMWEYDWNKINKSIKVLQRKFRNFKVN